MKRVSVVETNLTFTQPLQPRQATRFFVVHHFGELPAGFDLDKIDARWTHEMHIRDRGWAGGGYHYLIKTNGIIERVRPRQTIGSQCKGHNSESMGICVVGDFTAALPTAEQLTSLQGLLADLCDVYGLPATIDTIRGHRDLVDTACPGDALYALLPDIREHIRGIRGY